MNKSESSALQLYAWDWRLPLRFVWLPLVGVCNGVVHKNGIKNKTQYINYDTLYTFSFFLIVVKVPNCVCLTKLYKQKEIKLQFVQSKASKGPIRKYLLCKPFLPLTTWAK